jgi:lipid-binding SYLF domain-containing protein
VDPFTKPKGKTMKRLVLIALVGALAACNQQAADSDTTNADTTAATNADTTTYENDPSRDQKVMAALETCKKVEPTCADGNPAGYFVFPDVTSVALGVGGSGGEGALVQDGKITGYYNMGQGSIGLEAGVSAASFVLKVNDPTTLKKYQANDGWSVGADANVTVAQAGATAKGQAAGKGTMMYVFNSEGLMGNVSVNGMKIWPAEGNAGATPAATTTS